MRKKHPEAPSAEGSASKRPHRRELRWDKLDNSAHLFPVIAKEQMSNVYRISVTLTELVQPELLQQALDLILPRYDGFNMRLRKGVFWNYFEENGKPAPRVRPERDFPCRFIRSNQSNSYLFRVSYHQYRINLEVFHVLTDGMGGFNFLKELTYQYLRLLHPELVAETGDSLSHGMTLNREDSFLKHYKKAAKKQYKTQKAYQLKGERLPSGEFGVMHGYIKTPELKEVCRRYGVSINEYLVGAYIWSVYTEFPNDMKPGRPIRVAVPVNLRPYFGSITTKNFFVMISAEFVPTDASYTFEQVLQIVRESLRSQLDPAHLEQIFSYNVSSQKHPILKVLPLPLKHLGMRLIYQRSARANTSTITNVGVVDIAPPYKPYIELFHAYLAMSQGQHVKGTVCSYNGILVFSFSYDLRDPSVQRGFFRRLAQDGLQIEIESNGVNYG